MRVFRPSPCLVVEPMDADILLCTDLDRTVLPNGAEAESPQARPRLRKLADRPELTLVYVSGRDQKLLQEAIREFDVPAPDFAIGDVGTTLYAVDGERWRVCDSWRQHIAPDWGGLDHAALADLLAELPELTLQEPEKQSAFKLSYYASPGTEIDSLLRSMRERLRAHGVRAILPHVDEHRPVHNLESLEDLALALAR